MGCVPVAYDLPSGSVEIIEHGSSGLLVPPGSLRGLARSVAELHADRDTLARLSAGAVTRARTAFGIETTAAATVAFIRDVIERARQRPADRLAGGPPVSGQSAVNPPARGYQRLPAEWRLAAHRLLCAFPWLANRVYNR